MKRMARVFTIAFSLWLGAGSVIPVCCLAMPQEDEHPTGATLLHAEHAHHGAASPTAMAKEIRKSSALEPACRNEGPVLAMPAIEPDGNRLRSAAPEAAVVPVLASSGPESDRPFLPPPSHRWALANPSPAQPIPLRV
jgi:hypothetical protein